MDGFNLERLEQLVLFGGTLTEVSLLDDQCFTMRTVSDAEERYISLKTRVNFKLFLESKKKGKEITYNELIRLKHYLSCYIAHSILFINGLNVLPERSRYLKILEDYFQVVDYEMLTLLYNKLMNQRNSEYELFQSMDDFCKTSFANCIYTALKSIPLNSYSLTGIPGSENLPLSHIQLIFQQYMSQDEFLKIRETFFSFFKFIGSFINHKAVQKIDSQEKQEKIDKILRRRNDLRNVYGVLTKEDLLSQYNRMKDGIEDEHDIIIKEEERSQYGFWRQAQVERIAAYNKTREELDGRAFKAVELSEVKLREEYVKIFKHSAWLLDELT